MRLERIESLSELKHGDKVRLAIGAYHLKDVIVALSSMRPHLVFFCQSVWGGLDGGHRVEANSVGRRYGWSVGTLNQPRYYGIRGLRRLRPGVSRVEQPEITITETTTPDGRRFVTRRFTGATSPVTTGGLFV